MQQMPCCNGEKNKKSKAYAFNATALHELSHSTGHPMRLNRPQGAFFGTEQYAYEELVAEMCSCFMGAELQTEATPQQKTLLISS